MKLEGKTAVVTGASRGIGRSIALQLAKEGANVVVNYSGNEQKANEVVAEVEQFGRKSIAIQANVSNSEQVDAMIKQTIETFGQIDILVNNAGITRDMLLMRMKEEDFDAVIETNLKGVFLCTKAVTRPM
ncbi:MAG TPA: SDR family NAD(P)-dependent oxidoreductase, partial [Massilibacterium sp.]|nr:SDR family NAD(P)-dependent oxidoreductase [Massilibacterium sp.]